MRTRYFLIIPLLFLFSSLSFGQSKIFFDYSAAAFRGGEGKNIVEFYYAIYQKFLIYSSSEGSYSAAAKLNIYIIDKAANKVLFTNSYKIPSIVTDTANLKTKLIGQINYEMKYGDYKIIMAGSDFDNPSNKDSVEFDLKVENFNDGVQISDVELSTAITKSSDTKNLFYKNTLEVLPNPGGLYGTNVSDLYYYCELYNLSADKISEEFVLRKRILNTNNEELYSSEKKIKRGAESRVDFGMIKIDTLNTGSYILEISVIDAAKNVNVSRSGRFFLYTTSGDNLSSNTGQDEYVKSEYSIMTEKEIDELYQKMLYIKTDQEKEVYENMKTLDEKRKFMFAFWKKKDNLPGTPQNEFKIAFFKRMAEANRQFKEDFREGWKTDRGRIYVLYGVPDEINHYPFEKDIKSYDEWKFDALQGGVYAIFVEKSIGTGEYVLVTSNIRGEFVNPDWKKELKRFETNYDPDIKIK